MKRSRVVSLSLLGSALLASGCGGSAPEGTAGAGDFAPESPPSTAPSSTTHSSTHATTHHSNVGTVGGAATGWMLSRWLFGSRPSAPVGGYQYGGGYPSGYSRPPSGGSAPSAPRAVTSGGFGSTGQAFSSGSSS